MKQEAEKEWNWYHANAANNKAINMALDGNSVDAIIDYLLRANWVSRKVAVAIALQANEHAKRQIKYER